MWRGGGEGEGGGGGGGEGGGGGGGGGEEGEEEVNRGWLFCHRDDRRLRARRLARIASPDPGVRNRGPRGADTVDEGAEAGADTVDEGAEAVFVRAVSSERSDGGQHGCPSKHCGLVEGGT